MGCETCCGELIDADIETGLNLIFRSDHPDGVDQARNITENCQKDIDPEVHAEADFEKDSQRWNQYRQDYSYYISHSFLSVLVTNCP